MQTTIFTNPKKDLKFTKKKKTEENYKHKNYLHNLLKLMYCKLTAKYQNYVHPKFFNLVNSTYGHLNRYALKLFLFSESSVQLAPNERSVSGTLRSGMLFA